MLNNKYLVPLVAVLYLAIPAISVAVPQRDIGLVLYPVYFQNESPWHNDVYAGRGECTIEQGKCKCPDGKKCINDVGCAITSMTMLLRAYGLTRIPDQYHSPILEQSLNPGNIGEI